MPRKHRKLDKLYNVNGTDLKTEKSMNGPVRRLGGSRRATVCIRISALNKKECFVAIRMTYSEHD